MYPQILSLDHVDRSLELPQSALPNSIISPLGSTTSIPKIWLVVTPYFSVCVPPEFQRYFRQYYKPADWMGLVSNDSLDLAQLASTSN